MYHSFCVDYVDIDRVTDGLHRLSAAWIQSRRSGRSSQCLARFAVESFVIASGVNPGRHRLYSGRYQDFVPRRVTYRGARNPEVEGCINRWKIRVPAGKGRYVTKQLRGRFDEK